MIELKNRDQLKELLKLNFKMVRFRFKMNYHKLDVL